MKEQEEPKVEDRSEELWEQISAASDKVFWKEQQRVTAGIALSDLRKIMEKYTIS